MDRRNFLTAVTALPLIQNLSDGTQELILPTDLANGLERHCSLPLEERHVYANEAAKIAKEITLEFGGVMVYASNREKYDYAVWSWLHTQKRWKQMWMVEQIANAGEFEIVKRDQYFVLRTTNCKLPLFRTSERPLVVDFDNEWTWHEMGGGWPSFIRG